MERFRELSERTELTELINACREKNDYLDMTDKDILNLTLEEFDYISGDESFMARLFMMENMGEIKKFIDKVEIFALVYFWYSTNLGLKWEDKYVKDLSIDLFNRVWQHLGQYVTCGWPALKRAQKEGNSGRMSNMDGQPRQITMEEKCELIDEIAHRISIIRENLGEEYIGSI